MKKRQIDTDDNSDASKICFQELAMGGMCGEIVIPTQGGGEEGNLMLIYIVFNIHIEMQIVVMETKGFLWNCSLSTRPMLSI